MSSRLLGSKTRANKKGSSIVRTDGREQARMRPGGKTERRLRLLHLVNSVRSTNAHYNEHCLPMAHERDISICTFRDASLTPPAEITLFEGGGTLRGYWRALRAAVDRASPDVIHAHSPHMAILFTVQTLLSRRRTMARAVYTVHNCYQNYRLRTKLLLYPIFVAFPSIALCSESALESLPTVVRWLGRRKITVVQNAVDIGRIDGVLQSRGGDQPKGGFTVVSVGQLIDRKNPLTLMAAFDRATDRAASLVYVGDGQLRSRLAEESVRLGLEDRVEFTGLLDRNEVYRRLAGADLFVSASSGEGLPVAVLEAMACSRPVVLSDIAPHREIARGVDFIPLIPPDDVERLARELRRFGRMSVEERRAIGTKCRRHVEERFGLSAMHRSYERVYADLIGDLATRGDANVEREDIG